VHNLADTDTILLNYPEATFQGFAVDRFQHLPKHAENMKLILASETQHDQARIAFRRIGSYIGEAEIQGH
jgi:hypothetical protein